MYIVRSKVRKLLLQFAREEGKVRFTRVSNRTLLSIDRVVEGICKKWVQNLYKGKTI